MTPTITHVPLRLCPKCGHTLNAASDFRTDAVPQPGDVTLCIECLSILTFNDDMTVRKMTAKERRELEPLLRADIYDMRRKLRTAHHDYGFVKRYGKNPHIHSRH